MKKLLALVLALVMTLGLATVAANASYADESEINLTEAVEVMSKVGVFQGADGKFSPKANLTREQAAKLVAYLALGEKAAEALPALKVFDDVDASRWSAKYIAYCADAGYIAGNGAGKFFPDAELTGYAFGKMVLCVLGYDAKIEGFTGSSWTLGVAKLMQKNGIDNGVDAVASAVLTREQAAQYCMNALKADCVEYEDKGSVISIGEAQIVSGAKAAKTAVITPDGTKYSSINNLQDNNGKDYLQLGEKIYKGDLVLAKNETDKFGNLSEKWTYKNGEIGTYAVVPDAVLKNGTTFGDIYTAVGKTAVDSLQKAGSTSTLTLTIDGVTVVNNATVAAGAANAGETALDDISKGSKTDYAYGAGTKANGNGSVTNVFVKRNNASFEVYIAVVNTYIGKISNVTAATAKKDRNVTVAKKDNFANNLEVYETEEFAKDDFVLYTVARNSAGTKWEIQSMKKVTPIEAAEITSVKTKNSGASVDTVTAGGTTYKLNKACSSAFEIGSEYDLYLDDAGYIAFAEMNSNKVSYSNYLAIIEDALDNTALNNDYVANAVTLDGTKLSNIKLNKLDGNKINGTSTAPAAASPVNVTVGAIYKYTKNSDGKYDLKSVTNATTPYVGPVTAGKSGTVAAASQSYSGTDYDFHAGKTSVAAGVSANNSTKFIVVNKADSNKVYVYEGVAKVANVLTPQTGTPAASTPYQISYLAKNTSASTAKVVVVLTNAKPANNTAESKDVVFLASTKFSLSKSGDDDIYSYTVVKNGAESTLKLKNATLMDGNTPAANLAAHTILWVEEYDGEYAKTVKVYGNAGATALANNNPSDYKYYDVQLAADDTTTATVDESNVAKYSDSVLSFTSGQSFLCNDKTQVTFINTDDEVSASSVDNLESTNADYHYWIVTKTTDNVESVLFVFIEER